MALRGADPDQDAYFPGIGAPDDYDYSTDSPHRTPPAAAGPRAGRRPRDRPHTRRHSAPARPLIVLREDWRVVHPTPETLEALSLLEEQGDYFVALSLDAVATRASEIVPDLLALRLDMLDVGLTFTMTTSPSSTSELSSTSAVGSALALPLIHNGRVDGTINLFARSSTAFEGRGEHLAKVLGAAAPIPVNPAETPVPEPDEHATTSAAQRIREQDLIEQAVGFIASAQDSPIDDATEAFHRAVDDSGESAIETAETVLQRDRLE